jgi:hypothetical protein
LAGECGSLRWSVSARSESRGRNLNTIDCDGVAIDCNDV